MAALTDTFDLGRLQLSSGEGRRLTLGVRLGTLDFGGEHYAVEPESVDATLDLSRMTGGGYAMRLRFAAGLTGPCMRCLEPAAPVTEVDVREVDLQAWAHDAYALALPAQVVCTPECAGLCPECGANLNTAEPGHHHDRAPDPRWAKLRELRFD
jgi:uncharacterized protein